MSKLFQRAKLAVKFRRAGEGHSLSDSSTPSSSNESQPQQPRKAPTSDAQKAGQAAMTRFSEQDKPSRPPKSATTTWKSSTSEPFGTSETDQNIVKIRNTVKAEVGREMLASGTAIQEHKEKEIIRQEAAPVLAVSGVYFKCPFCFKSFRRQEVNYHMEECLTKSLEDDQILTPVNMIRTLNKDQVKVQSCVDVFCRYLDNILQNPDEDKYRRIKKGNKVFQERIGPVKGSVEFLQSCGFVEIPLPDSQDEMCFMLEEISPEVLEKLTVMKEVLLGTERCKPTLDRSLKVLQPSSSDQTLELPDDFFQFNSDEVKRMQVGRTEEVERNSQLRTRAMREKEERNTARKYRFTLLRVRFPDQVILQGTFNAHEKTSALMSFIREQLQCDWLPFTLSEPGGRQLVEEESTFAELGLIPAAILNFVCDASVMADITAAGTVSSTYIKPELLEEFKDLQPS